VLVNGWTRKDGHFLTVLDRQEAAVVRGLVSQIQDMLQARADEAPRDELAQLTGIRTGPASAPDDPILGRLLPDFHRLDHDDATAADENSARALRSLHEPELVEQKTGVAGVVLRTCPPRGGRVMLDGEQAQAWLSALNDVRLALGTALEVTEEMPDELPDEDPRSAHLGVYHWLTWVQESLVQAVMG
jgi:hypothetical protein